MVVLVGGTAGTHSGGPRAAVSPPPEPSFPSPPDRQTADATVEPATAPEDPDRLWEAVRRQCPWPPPAALEWIGALPVPPGDPAAHRHERPPITQALYLYDAARRLGGEIPDWALKKLELRAEVRARELANGSG